jgi:hypothetical protein
MVVIGATLSPERIHSSGALPARPRVIGTQHRDRAGIASRRSISAARFPPHQRSQFGRSSLPPVDEETRLAFLNTLEPSTS